MNASSLSTHAEFPFVTQHFVTLASQELLGFVLLSTRGQQTSPAKGQLGTSFGLWATKGLCHPTQLCCWSRKAVTDNVAADGCGWVPIKLLAAIETSITYSFHVSQDICFSPQQFKGTNPF